jgi:multicomponent Na+:H+ antiporter subunit B
MERPRHRGSPVVPKTVRVIAPFALTFGLFTMFHGTKSVGGGFQGGVVVGSVVVTIAFAFGIERTRRALDPRALVGGAAAGVVVFGLVALGGTFVGDAFLDVTRVPIPDGTVYAVELVEIGIGVTVASVVALLFFEIAGGGDG